VAQYYPWFVFVHLVGLVVFVAAHGVSMWASFRIREDRDPRVVASHLASSKAATQATYVGLLLLGIGGLGAAWVGNQLLAPWVVGSYVVLAIVLLTMWIVATPYYLRLRMLAGSGEPAPGRTEIDRLLDSPRPNILMAVGAIGLIVLVWLMVLKPG
jgi:uncharacterized membrane protein